MNETKLRLRRVLLDELLAARGVEAVNDQVALLGISRATFHRLRRGEAASLATAVQMGNALGLAWLDLFEVEGPK